MLTLRTSSLVITCRWLSSSLPSTVGRATTGFWSLYFCKPACGHTWECPWEPACTLMASELCALDHFAPEFLAVFLGLQATTLNQPSPPPTMSMMTMKRRMTMKVTSMALLAILHMCPTPCPSHTQASVESPSPTHSAAVGSKTVVCGRSAYHKPLSNYAHCSEF